MRITKITQQKNRTDRYSVFIDGEYSFPLTDLEFTLSGLREGQDLSELELSELKNKAIASKAYDRAMNYLSFRVRSKHEVVDYLKRKGFAETEIELVTDKLERHKFIDDSQFASSWIADRKSLKPRSRARLKMELRQKGLNDEAIEEALSEVSQDDELTSIRKLINKKLTRTKYQDQRKLISYLVGQGFNYDLVKRALEPKG